MMDIYWRISSTKSFAVDFYMRDQFPTKSNLSTKSSGDARTENGRCPRVTCLVDSYRPLHLQLQFFRMRHSAHGPHTWLAHNLARRAPQAGAGTQATRVETG